MYEQTELIHYFFTVFRPINHQLLVFIEMSAII